MALTVVERKVDSEAVVVLEDALALARRGELLEVIVVGNAPEEGAYFNHCYFSDRWRLLGALQYAMAAVT